MKMRIISIVFCLIAFTVSLVLMFNIYNTEAEPKLPAENNGDDIIQNDHNRTEPLSETSIKKLSADVSAFINTLAYENDKNYSVKMQDYIDQLERSAEYLGTEKQDASGKAYLSEIASVFRNVLTTPYMSTTELSSFVSGNLTRLKTLVPGVTADAELYPSVDTDANGAFTLAMVAVNNTKKPSDVFTVSVGGGVLLGDVVGASENTFASEVEKRATNSFPLGGLSPVFSSDDYSIVTLRNPLTAEATSDDTRTAVKGKPEYVSMLSAAGINAVNLASDHMGDYGDKGLADTKIALSGAGINFALNAEVCEYNTSIGPVALISYDLNSSAVSNNANAVNNTVKEAISLARSRGAVMVITMFSWKGNENREISDYQVSVGRTAVDNGADMVVGTFPQYIQAIDIYKGKTLIYSTNDILNGKTDILGSDTVANPGALIISQDYKYTNGTLVPADITFYPVMSTSAGDKNDFTPRLVFDAQADNIIESFKKACVCTRYGLAKESNPAKQEVKYIRIGE
ncbi:MAG: hypothetical protein E7588_01025 [Ruminococcaceae bacterium]|nr:hypothetical protein [Oscillospiraceae bacterium]